MIDTRLAISLPSEQADTRIDISVSVSGDIIAVVASSFMGGSLVSRDSLYLGIDEAKKLSILLYQAINAKGGL